VTLEDVSRMDVPAEVLGRVEIADPGNPPYAFEIPYDADAIDERHSYSVRARITRDGTLMFTTDTATPVLTRGAGNEVELLLKRVGGGSTGPSPREAAAVDAVSVSELEDTYWKLTRLADRPVTVSEGQREPHLVLGSQDGRLKGFAGCNQMTGPYSIDGSSIEFGPIAMTQRACLGGMETEATFARALDAAVSYRLLAHHLELIDADGTTVARFEARELD
jgi:putative lipoprotein